MSELKLPPLPIRLERLVIGAPFGNYISRPGHATSVLGTYTRHYRGSILYRLWRMLRTLRYDRHMQGWINKLGLPNPGILSLLHRDDATSCGLYDKVLSIHGFYTIDWIRVINVAARLPVMALELNCSCPNVKNDATDWDEVFKHAVRRWGQTSGIIVKLPPIGWRKLFVQASLSGISAFHCCNTLPTPKGGLSGPVLKQFSLEVIREIRRDFPETQVLIGGGGIRGTNDIVDYIEAGASHFAVASMLLNPWRHAKYIFTEKGPLEDIINFLDLVDREGYAGDPLPFGSWPDRRIFSPEF